MSAYTDALARLVEQGYTLEQAKAVIARVLGPNFTPPDDEQEDES